MLKLNSPRLKEFRNGVQKQLTKLNIFPTVRRQLYDVLVAEFGDLADFIIGEKIIFPPAPDLHEMAKFSEFKPIDLRCQYLKALEKYYPKRDTFMRA